MKKVYLDSNATTRVHPEVIEAMRPFYDEIYGNASSVHSFGREAKKHMEKAREQVADLFHADSPDEVVFASGGTESDNFAIKGTLDAYSDKGNHIITSISEHAAVLNTCKFVQRHQGAKATFIGVDNYGMPNLDELKDAITDKTVLISIMAANNETGSIMPIEEIGKIAADKGIQFHTDAVQFFGKVPFDPKKLGIQLASVSSHKIHGPKGVGALYIKKGTKIERRQQGGHHENKRRAGTENVPGIVGFGKACEIALKQGTEHCAKVKELRDYLYDRLSSEIRQIRLNGHPEKRLPNTANISFDYLEGESIILSLDLEGIAASTGSACTSGSLEPSHVLKAMGIETLFAQGSIRFSLSMFNTKEEIDYVVEKLPPIVERLRKMSPVYKEE